MHENRRIRRCTCEEPSCSREFIDETTARVQTLARGPGGGGDYDPAAGGNFDDDVSYISLSSQPSIFAAVETLEDAVVGSSQPTEPLGSAYNGRLRRSSRIEQRARRKAKPRPGKAEKERSSKIRSRSEWERAPE